QLMVPHKVVAVCLDVLQFCQYTRRVCREDRSLTSRILIVRGVWTDDVKASPLARRELAAVVLFKVDIMDGQDLPWRYDGVIGSDCIVCWRDYCRTVVYRDLLYRGVERRRVSEDDCLVSSVSRGCHCKAHLCGRSYAIGRSRNALASCNPYRAICEIAEVAAGALKGEVAVAIGSDDIGSGSCYLQATPRQRVKHGVGSYPSP